MYYYFSEYIKDDEAIGTIENCPDQDEFINKHLKQWWLNERYCDNSVELANLWNYCKSVYDEYCGL